MLVLQSGTDVYGINEDKNGFKQLPLSYDKYPTNPTPESLNEGIEWFLDFLARNFPQYTILIHEESGAGGQSGTAAIVYLDVMQGSSVKGDPIAIYTICNAITTSSEQNLETTLKTQLSKL